MKDQQEIASFTSYEAEKYLTELRDTFAAAALTGLLANREGVFIETGAMSTRPAQRPDIVAEAYRYADELLLARKKNS